MSNRDLLNLLVGADAAMYVNITKYGSTYPVIDSMVVATASAKLLDLKIGAVLWAGSASASNNEGGNNSGGGLIGALVAAAVKQIINSTTDQSHPVAGVAGARLLSGPARPTACCMARARKNTWRGKSYCLTLTPASWATPASVVWAALRPSRKSLSE
jgi:hypothetical protein